MGWGDCGYDTHGRAMGYAIQATCDEKGCPEKIDRGLSYVCGGMHEGGEFGCGGYFCEGHMFFGIKRGSLCKRCLRRSGDGWRHWYKRDTETEQSRADRAPSPSGKPNTGGRE